jgi:hypothetical protein
MDYQFQQLTPSDLDVLKQLLRVFGEAFEDVATCHRAL